MQRRKSPAWLAQACLAPACLAIAAVLLLLCTQCSPLYPTNVWVDANCLLTVGRVMRAGGVLYRDIYEQKGPTLYLLHAIAACMSDTSFLGVYVLEVLSLAAALYAACRLLLLRVRAALALPAASLMTALVLAGGAFSRGDSAEEFCLPLLMAAVYVAFREYGARPGPMRARALFACGLLAGVVATIKFTILGLFVGLCAAEGVIALRAGGLRRALRSAGAFLAGMLLPIAAWCAYFAWHGALADAYTVYIYNNVFLYGGDPQTLTELVRELWAILRGNAAWMAVAAAGMAALCLRRREPAQLRGALAAMAVGAAAAVFLLGRLWLYSPLVLGVFAFPAMLPLLGWLERRRAPRMAGTAGVLAAGALSLAVAWNSPNAFLRFVPYEGLAQARLAAYVHEGATLLQYSALDDGLYLASHRLPQQRYFVRLNVQCEEMHAELDRYVEEAIPDYVLCTWEPLPERFDRYQLIATDAGYDERNRINKLFYLYRRR
ncbi:MAG: hypothetical protein ACI4PG_05735 [Candidatus Ventricola sp.]